VRELSSATEGIEDKAQQQQQEQWEQPGVQQAPRRRDSKLPTNLQPQQLLLRLVPRGQAAQGAQWARWGPPRSAPYRSGWVIVPPRSAPAALVGQGPQRALEQDQGLCPWPRLWRSWEGPRPGQGTVPTAHLGLHPRQGMQPQVGCPGAGSPGTDWAQGHRGSSGCRGCSGCKGCSGCRGCGACTWPFPPSGSTWGRGQGRGGISCSRCGGGGSP